MRSFRPGPSLAAAIVSLATFAGCGGEEPTAKSPAVGAEGGGAGTPTASPAGTHAPSAALQALARPSAKDSLALYADLDTPAKSSLVTELVRPLLVEFGHEMSAETRSCAGLLASNLRELAIGGDGSDFGGSFVTFRLATGTAHDALVACATAEKGEHPAVSIPGTDEAVVAHAPLVMARRGDVLVSGPPAALTKLLAEKPQPWPAFLTLGPDGVLVAKGSHGDVAGEGTLTVSASRLVASVDVTFPDEATARAIKEQATQIVSPAIIPASTPAADKADLTRVLHSFRFTQNGPTASFALDLEEEPRIQAADLAKVMGLGIYGTRQYILRSKKVEALFVLHELGKEYAAAFAAEPSKGHPRPTRLHSFPAVPREVPSGVRYASSEADWASWKDLGFAMSEPQFFQYEIKAAKDGKSADIIARGDLDGDGKTSELKLHVTLDEKTHELTVPIAPTETDGDE